MRENNEGFTLVELLAVIVIMGILMMVAIPSVTRTIENSRKDTFVDIAKSYGNAARTLWTSDNLTCNGVVSSAVDDGDYYILINSKSGAKESLPVLVDQGGKSSWGNRDVNGYVRVNISTTPGVDDDGDGVFEKEPKRVTKFYVALSDGTHGLVDDNTLMMDELKRGNVVMTLTAEQLKKIEFTLDDGKLNCSRDANGRYSCTNVTPIKNMTGVCVDDNTTVATVPSSPTEDVNSPVIYNAWYRHRNPENVYPSIVSYLFTDTGLMLTDLNYSSYSILGGYEIDMESIVNEFDDVSADKKTIVIEDESFILDETSLNTQYKYFYYQDLNFYVPYTEGLIWSDYSEINGFFQLDDRGYVYDNDDGIENPYYIKDVNGNMIKGTELIVEGALYTSNKS